MKIGQLLTYENETKSSAVSALVIVHRNPGVSFRFVNCMCIGEVDGRCMGWRLAEENDALTLGIV